jgi:hypothetical protein
MGPSILVAVLAAAGLSSETPDASGPLIACAGGPSRSWVRVRHRKAIAFVGAVKAAAFEFAEDRPFDCGLELKAQCGPDLDGDGKSDIIVRAAWSERGENPHSTDDMDAADFAACHDRRFRGPESPSSSLFLLLSADAGSPLGRVQLLEDQTGSGREGPTPVSYTRWQRQPALTLHLSFYPSEGGFSKHRERTLIVREGRLQIVSESPWRIIPE